MVLEVAALIVAVINAIFAGQPLFSKLWQKIKAFFGGSSKLTYLKVWETLLKFSFLPQRGDCRCHRNI